MSVRVSVIVAVFNTGEYIEPLIDSLLRQTLPRDQFEMIFVDDGSTDEVTPARLDRLAAEETNVVVRHEPNSGWPGRPRNVGMDIARGKYVFFADHDDWFGVEALQRMVDYADECGSDVLIPRYAGHHRGVAKAMFGRSQCGATLESTPLMDSLTPHKLFRLGFVQDEGLRFPEGKRRLEDHVFVVDAYFRARTISVLADYHCYFHIGRPDAGNAGFDRIDPPSYYGYVREVVDIVYRHTEPGPLRDRVLRRPLRQELLGRLDGGGLLKRPLEHTRSVFDEARAIAVERIPENIDAGLSPPQRVRAALLRAGRFDDLLAYVEHQAGIKARVRLTGLRWEGGELVLELEGELVDRGAPVAYRRDGDALYLTEPTYSGGAPVGVAVTSGTSPLRSGSIGLVLRRREDSEEWPIATDSAQQLDGDSASYRGHARFDPHRLGGGRLLTAGVWDFYAKVNQTGWSKEVRLGSLRDGEVDCPPAVHDGVPLTPYWTETYDNLSLEVGSFARLVRWAHPQASVADGQLVVVLTAAGTPPAEAECTFRPVGDAGDTAPIGRPAGGDGWTFRVPVHDLPAGRYSIALGGTDLRVVLLVRPDGGLAIEAADVPPPITKPITKGSTKPTVRERVLGSAAGPWLRRARRRVRQWRAGRR